MKIEIEPIGRVEGARTSATDDFWGGHTSRIVLDEGLPEDALEGLDAFSHAEVLFFFDRVDPADVVHGRRRPRGNPAWPEVGILAQRGRSRPNRIGSTIVRVLACRGRVLTVSELDAIDGTPVLDVKPVMREFLPRGELRQPPWSTELMRRYWEREEGGA